MVRGVRPAPIDGKPPPAKGSPPTTPTKELSDAAQYEKSSRCPLNLENSLALLVALLSILSLAAQLSCDHLLRQGVDLGSSDEQRIALRIADIEADITRSFDARQIDASADDAGADWARAAARVQAPRARGGRQLVRAPLSVDRTGGGLLTRAWRHHRPIRRARLGRLLIASGPL